MAMIWLSPKPEFPDQVQFRNYGKNRQATFRQSPVWKTPLVNTNTGQNVRYVISIQSSNIYCKQNIYNIIADERGKDILYISLVKSQVCLAGHGPVCKMTYLSQIQVSHSRVVCTGGGPYSIRSQSLESTPASETTAFIHLARVLAVTLLWGLT